MGWIPSDFKLLYFHPITKICEKSRLGSMGCHMSKYPEDNDIHEYTSYNVNRVRVRVKYPVVYYRKRRLSVTNFSSENNFIIYHAIWLYIIIFSYISCYLLMYLGIYGILIIMLLIIYHNIRAYIAIYHSIYKYQYLLGILIYRIP